MTGAAGSDPDTTGTDPLVTVVAEAIRERLKRTYSSPPMLFATGGNFYLGVTEHDLARVALAAVRAHQNTAGQQAAAQALRDAADAICDLHDDSDVETFWDPGRAADCVELCAIEGYLRARADTLNHDEAVAQQTAAVMFGEKRCNNSLQYRRDPSWYHNCDLILGHDGMHQEASWFHDDIAQGKIPVVIRWGTWESAGNPDVWPADEATS